MQSKFGFQKSKRSQLGTKRRIASLLCFLIYISLSHASTRAIVRHHETELRATVIVGKVLTLRTEPESISAYHWIAKSSDVDVLRLAGEPRLESVNEDLLGGLARTRFRFDALSTGAVDITFSFIIRSTGDNAEAADRFVLHVRVIAK
jgi:hypothetical protein